MSREKYGFFSKYLSYECCVESSFDTERLGKQCWDRSPQTMKTTYTIAKNKVNRKSKQHKVYLVQLNKPNPLPPISLQRSDYNNGDTHSQ